jgi:hypothetical protein
VIDQIAAFASAVGAILSLDPAAILAVQNSPGAFSAAIWILLLGTLSDVIGDSPLLFMKRMRRGRFAAAVGIEAGLSMVRLAIWILSFWILLSVLNLGNATLTEVVLVVGLGYAPMLLSFLVLIPYLGTLIGRVLQAWTLLTILASIAVAANSSLWQVLAPALVAVLLILVVRRWSDRVSVAVLGGVSRRFVGADVMQRTRAMDPRLVMSGGNG